MLQIQGDEEIGYYGIFFLWNQQETKILEGYNLINGARL